jgi:hypothetical protein
MITVEELGQEIVDLATRVDVATHRLLECIRQFDESGEWEQQGAVSCAHWLAWRIGLDQTTAREKVRVARALGKLPAIDGAFRKGQLSYAKVRALTRVATPQNELHLLEMALVATGAQLERLCRGYGHALSDANAAPPAERSVRRRDLPGGMVKLEIVLLPDEADLVLRALDKAREPSESQKSLETTSDSIDSASSEAAKSRYPSRVDGMLSISHAFLANPKGHGGAGPNFQVMVHVGQDPLAADGVFAATLEDGTHISAEAFRRVSCDSGMGTVSDTGQGMTVGRRTRSIPSAMRRALMVRDHGCRFPGCTHNHFLHGHHIQHWLHGGDTSVDNLVMLCSHHHHLVHEGGFTLSRSTEGQLIFSAPDGKLLNIETPSPITEDVLVWLQEWTHECGVDVGPDSNLPLWDGTQPDYDWAISALLRAA